MKHLNGFQLDKNHTFVVMHFDAVKDLANLPTEYSPPALPEYAGDNDVHWWLRDNAFRDQFCLRYALETEIYWGMKNIIHTQTDQIEQQVCRLCVAQVL